jgi:hypothetical protein
MDGQLSDAHRTRQLLDLVDHAWLTDSLSDDELHLPDGASSEQVEEVDESSSAAAVLTDREGASWSLSVGKHSNSSLAASSSGLAPQNNQLAFLAPGIGQTPSQVESADGLRWTDLALQGFASTAQKQPNH